MVHRRAIGAWSLAVLALATLVAGSARAQICTLTAGATSYVIPATSHYDGTPVSNFTGVGTGDYLFEDGWWFRIAGDTQESFFPPPDTTACVGTNVTVFWANVSARGFRASNSLLLTSIGANQGEVILQMAITNLSAVNPLVISIFHGADFDVNGSSGTDNAVLLNPNNYIRITDTIAGVAEYRAHNPAANAFLVRPNGATDVFGELGDANVDNFDNTTLPTSNFDFTGAFQWDLIIPASGTATARVALNANMAPAFPVELIGVEVE